MSSSRPNSPDFLASDGLGIADHLAMDDIAEMALEHTHRLLLGVAARPGIRVQLPRARLVTQLGDRHDVQH
jgi:hypothetical protein